MIASTKIKYAVNALVLLASNSGSVISAKEISEKLSIPKEFISKILQSLVPFGLVKSFKGKNGGFALEINPQKLTVAKIFSVLDYEAVHDVCWLGLAGQCDNQICSLCKDWEKMSSQFEKTINEINLKTLVDSNFSGKS